MRIGKFKKMLRHLNKQRRFSISYIVSQEGVEKLIGIKKINMKDRLSFVEKTLKAKSPLQRAFPGFPYNLLVVAGNSVNLKISFTISFYMMGFTLSRFE